METVASPTKVHNSGPTFSAELLENETLPSLVPLHVDEVTFEIGLWLASLESFLNTSDHSFADKNRLKDASRDWTKEFRLTHAALLLCSKLNFRLRQMLADPQTAQNSIRDQDSDDLSNLLREAVVLNGGLIRAEPLKFEEWKAWNVLLSEKLKSSPVFAAFVENAEKSGENFLPENLQKLLRSKPIPFADQADLHLILPQFAKILKSLSVVGRMLQNDEPLKPTLLIFSRVYEQTQELITYINNRLARFPDEKADLFNSLDGASYTASLELKKVYNQELTGLVGIRPAPSIYARIETAYALLSDSFQQILSGFARLIEPGIAPADLFPSFRIKLEQSLALRQQLSQVLKAVKVAEQNPEKNLLEGLNKELTGFLQETIRFLFYKDKETLERFGEEILAISDKKDLVPILHRFGAYLETLSAQVNMRNVLANHPFEPATK